MSRHLISTVAFSLLAFQAAHVARGDWGQFLGPSRNGLSSEKGLLDRFADAQPKEIWRQPMVGGMSGIVIASGKLLTLSQSEGKQWLVALDSATGKLLWKTAIANEFQNAMGHGPRATPTVYQESVYAYTGEGILVSTSLSDGKIQWSKNLPVEFKGKPSDYGMSCSPLVHEGLVIAHVGSPGAAVVALDKKSGALAWKAGEGAAGYSSPVLLKLHGVDQVVSFIGNQVLSIEPKSGQVLWNYAFETDYYCNTACPIAIGNQVLISSGENQGSVLLGIEKSADPKGESQWKAGEIWKSMGTSSVLRSEWQTPILLDGCIYGFDNSGSAGPVTHLSCVDAATGKAHWKQLRFGKGNLIAADGKLIITTIKGELVMVKASKNAFEELGRKTVLGFTRQAPVLHEGKIYMRDEAEVVCLGLRSTSAP